MKVPEKLAIRVNAAQSKPLAGTSSGCGGYFPLGGESGNGGAELGGHLHADRRSARYT